MSSTKASVVDPGMTSFERPGRLAAGQDPVKRQQILDGANRVFSQMGFDAASMNDITREAGVSKGTIYVYFNNKEELFIDLCQQYKTALFDGIYQALESNSDLREALIQFGIALSTLITSNAGIQAQRVIIGVAERMPSMSCSFYEKGPKKGLAIMRALLDRHVAAGFLAIEDTEIAAYQLSDLFHSGLLRRRLFGQMENEPEPEQIRKTVTAGVDLFLKAYKA
ncbi:TetR/AcrR family transcriptional regulator [Phyllobacterium sp. 628]|uniref:TetR/AcrR family transcriptional regulator n=1 Tax=Phyllobacterium sp. 628 TaxID=2718938 RepID=UPI0016625960|nr:TetR/AcrR family transcriptional regulator [Phyllobacterium sp. 628]QND53931.1 TetR/AcrR family transcriptional regulator [Phyllobacterium sp. 628]